MATNKSKRLKYLGIEMLKKDASKSATPEVGLFRGLRERSDDSGTEAKTIRLILLGTKDKENDLKALNLAVFNVLSMKMLYGDTKELIVFKANDADQTAAMELLEASLKEFQEEKRMVDNDPEIVDISTFDDVPQEFFSPKKETKSTTQSYGYGNTYGGMGTGGANGTYQNDDWKAKQAERDKQKEKEEKMRWTPFLIKRKTEIPQLKILNSIKKKVLALAAGVYEEAYIDPDPEDTFTEDKKTTAV
jgi:hypothetical protein